MNETPIIPPDALLNPNRSRLPIYDGTRMFLGHKDLVISFYTKKCQFDCTYCALPLRSANAPVSSADLDAQIDLIFEKYRAELPEFRQFSFGNEGSALDWQRFHRASMDYLLERAKALHNLDVLSIETRPEYITASALEDILQKTHARTVDVTVGFETQNDAIRIDILKKRISRRDLEARIALLGRLGVRLTSYVMLKPAPRMTEEEGVREAVATIVYLREQCTKANVDLVVYLTPTYIAKGSQLDRICNRDDYLPPTIQSIFRVIVESRRLGVRIYTGVWHEGLAEEGNDFRGREGYDPAMRKAIVRFNQTEDSSFLEPFLERA